MTAARRTELLIALGLTAITLVVFWQVQTFDFVHYDDPEYVLKALPVREGLTSQGIRDAFTTIGVGNWHPLTWLSLMTDRQFFGMDPGAFHRTSMLIHLANVLLLFATLNLMTGEAWRSGLVAALFAIHPLHVESVAWIAERKDVLSTFFWMIVLWAYAHYARQPGWQWYLIVVVAFALGLMAKPMLVTLPCVLLLLDEWPLRRVAWIPNGAGQTPRRLIIEKLPLFALSAIASVVTVFAQGDAVGSVQQYSLPTRLANAVISYALYLVKMIWPIGLSSFYRYETNHATIPWLVGASGFLIVVTLLAIRWKQAPWVLVGWLWYLGTLVPVIGLVQVGAQAMADRYTYIPLIGIFLILAWSIPAAAFTPARRPISVALIGAVLASLMAVAWKQVGTWHDTETLCEHALKIDPDNWVAHLNLAFVLEEQGKRDEALAHNEAVLRVIPTSSEAHVNLTLLAERRGDWPAFLRHSQEAIRLKPTNPQAQNNMGMFWVRQGNFAKAVEHFQSAIRLAPNYWDARTNLGLALLDSGKPEQAVEQLRTVLQYTPDDADAHNNLARALYFQGQVGPAIAEFREALRLNPQHAQARAALDEISRQPAAH